MKFIKTELAKKLEEQRVGLDFKPTRGTPRSAALDLRACIEHDVTIFPDHVEKIPTGVKIWAGSEYEDGENPDEFFSIAGLIMARSSTEGLIPNQAVGLSDEDYQGEIFVKMRNNTGTALTVKSGERFAQLLFVPALIVELEQAEEFEVPTERGEGGFGSTNKEQPDPIGR